MYHKVLPGRLLLCTAEAHTTLWNRTPKYRCKSARQVVHSCRCNGQPHCTPLTTQYQLNTENREEDQDNNLGQDKRKEVKKEEEESSWRNWGGNEELRIVERETKVIDKTHHEETRLRKTWWRPKRMQWKNKNSRRQRKTVFSSRLKLSLQRKEWLTYFGGNKYQRHNQPLKHSKNKWINET